MIFSLLKLVIWIAGVGVIAYYGLPYVGYEVNTEYFEERKDECRKELDHCRKELFQGGVDGVRENCDLACVDPKILIKKQGSETENNEPKQ